jgi:predicted phosphodiesterase
MLVTLASDIHFEFYKSPHNATIYLDPVLEAKPEGVDTVILAGDIVCLNNSPMAMRVFRKFCQAFKHVLYTPGNHEYYNYSLSEGRETLQYLQKTYKNLHILNPGRVITIENQRFLGGTMWFPPSNIASNPVFQRQINDSRCILDWYDDVTAENALCLESFCTHLQQDDVVITHHLPSILSVNEEYVNNDINCYYVSPWAEKLMETRKPKVWIHGHSHKPVDYMFKDTTRVISNPIGYLHYENAGLTADNFYKILEI